MIPTRRIALEAEDVVKRYGPVVALDGVSITIFEGECVALVGESGSGKTTLLRAFNRMVDPDAGTIRVAGLDVAAADPIALRRSMGYVQQEGGLLPHWTVRRNAETVPWLRNDTGRGARAEEALALVGLDPATFGDRHPRQLSGGQRQRVAIARALAGRPSLLLMDEPFGALDAITRGELHESFEALRAEIRTTTVLVTHDLREAARLADRVAVMRAGRIEQVAAPGELVDAPSSGYVAALLHRAGLR
ncbi:MAG TPA: ATP-binding cassette domain-containing protein [Longimicrobiales bacterium]|nr:ATP-binding cassette domain-containing protein [Longimicrobiales bacterium]